MAHRGVRVATRGLVKLPVDMRADANSRAPPRRQVEAAGTTAVVRPGSRFSNCSNGRGRRRLATIQSGFGDRPTGVPGGDIGVAGGSFRTALVNPEPLRGAFAVLLRVRGTVTTHGPGKAAARRRPTERANCSRLGYRARLGAGAVGGSHKVAIEALDRDVPSAVRLRLVWAGLRPDARSLGAYLPAERTIP